MGNECSLGGRSGNSKSVSQTDVLRRDTKTAVKLILVGDSAVGKTSLMQRFCEDKFSQTFITTIGIDYKSKIIHIEGDEQKEVPERNIACHVWDTAGQERFRAITKAYLRGADGMMLVYDITSPESFRGVEHWITYIKDHVDSKISMVLVANKLDLAESRLVPTEAGKDLAKKYDIEYFETSARADVGIAEAFQSLAVSASIVTGK